MKMVMTMMMKDAGDESVDNEDYICDILALHSGGIQVHIKEYTKTLTKQENIGP